MPTIDEIQNKKRKKPTRKMFQKVSYRPWDTDETKELSDATETSSYIEKNNNRPIVKPETPSFEVVQTKTFLTEENLTSLHETFNKIDDSNNSNNLKSSKKLTTNEKNKINRSLYGVQRSILLFLKDHIEFEDDEYSYTSSISISDIQSYAKCSKNTVMTSISRLKKKEIMSPYEFKPGRGGYSLYKIKKAIIECFMDEKI